MIRSEIPNTEFRTFAPRKMNLEQMVRQCGVYATAKSLKNRGYTLYEALSMIAVATKNGRTSHE